MRTEMPACLVVEVFVAGVDILVGSVGADQGSFPCPSFWGSSVPRKSIWKCYSESPGTPLEGPFCEAWARCPCILTSLTRISLPHGVTPCTPVAHVPLGL